MYNTFVWQSEISGVCLPLLELMYIRRILGAYFGGGFVANKTRRDWHFTITRV